jgi:hypothetical protein
MNHQKKQNSDVPVPEALMPLPEVPCDAKQFLLP